jgi:hypothetical protein
MIYKTLMWGVHETVRTLDEVLINRLKGKADLNNA